MASGTATTEFGQAVRGINTGRGTGIIDTVSLIHAVQGIVLLESSGHRDANVVGGMRRWFADYLRWMTTSEKGLDEKKNHVVTFKSGYRSYADSVLERLEPRPSPFPLDLATARSEVEAAMRETTETLSRVTRLLALVSAPPLQTATVRHVEVLLLQPRVVMAVVITSTGGVSKRVSALSEPVDPGLVRHVIATVAPERLPILELTRDDGARAVVQDQRHHSQRS